MESYNRSTFLGASSSFVGGGGASFYSGGGGGIPNGSGVDHIIMLQKMGEEYLLQAQALEGQGKIEQAYKLFKEAANKFLYIIKNNEGLVDANWERDLR